jgi:hypothetical protein
MRPCRPAHDSRLHGLASPIGVRVDRRQIPDLQARHVNRAGHCHDSTPDHARSTTASDDLVWVSVTSWPKPWPGAIGVARTHHLWHDRHRRKICPNNIGAGSQLNPGGKSALSSAMLWCFADYIAVIRTRASADARSQRKRASAPRSGRLLPLLPVPTPHLMRCL